MRAIMGLCENEQLSGPIGNVHGHILVSSWKTSRVLSPSCLLACRAHNRLRLEFGFGR